MARIIGYAFAGLLLLNGLSFGIQPRFGFRLWNEGFRHLFPESVNRIAKEYSRLSDQALRTVALWEVTVAGVILWLTSRARDQRSAM